MSEKTTAWLYAAVSSSPQEESLAEQEAWGHAVAAVNGWAITRTFSGTATGKHGVRKILADLLAELRGIPKAQRPGRVLMVRMDRTGRMALETIGALAEIKRLGIQLHTRQDGDVRLDTALESVRPILQLISAEMENSARSDRARAGKARRRAAGLHNGNAPYGCILVEGRPVAYEPESAIVRTLFERRAQGWGYERLVSYAGRNAPPKLLGSGKSKKLTWGRSTVEGLLRCRTLREVVVAPDLWDEANRVSNPDFKARGRRSWPYPLAGALRCTCGMLLSGQTSGIKPSSERYYVCRRVAEHGYYPHWRASLAEAAFADLLARLSAEPQLLDPGADLEGATALRSRETAIRKTLEGIEERRRLIWGRAESLSGPQLRERLDEIDAERMRERAALEEVGSEIAAAARRTAAVEPLIDVLNRLAADWNEATLELKQETARAVAKCVGGLFVDPAPRTAPQLRRRGNPAPEILTGFELQRRTLQRDT